MRIADNPDSPTKLLHKMFVKNSFFKHINMLPKKKKKVNRFQKPNSK